MNRHLRSIAAVVVMSAAEVLAAPAQPAAPKVAPAVAKAVAGSLFPAQCGRAGERCTITHDERRGCPREFVVAFPIGDKSSEPIRVWVTLDPSGAVSDVSTNKVGGCGRALGG